MKNLVFFAAFLFVWALASCSNKKADASGNTGSADSAVIVLESGSVQVDSIAPDSAAVTVSDTTTVITLQ